MITRFAALLACALSYGVSPAAPTQPQPPATDLQVHEALARPALTARDAERAVLLGAAQAGTRTVVVGERGLVLLSDDGAATWRQSPTPVSVTLTAVRFADARHGYAIGHGGTVLATADGGATWARRLDGRRIADLEHAAAKASGDAGALGSAERLRADGPDKPLLDLLVFDAKRLLVVGAYGLALATEDGGHSWTSWRRRLGNPKEMHLYAVRRHGETLLIAGEQGLVLRSSDGGQNFARLTLPYRGSFFTAELPGDRSIVVAGLRGNAWRSVDDGMTWSPLASPVPASITGSAFDVDGTPLFVNQAGQVLVATPIGLQPRPGGPLPPLNALLPLPGGQLLTLSMQGLQRLSATTPKHEP
jgi:photosystem II stability/assembly factor-like uncharacterized protein